jgi:outer membrane protein assembly factor BamB
MSFSACRACVILFTCGIILTTESASTGVERRDSWPEFHGAGRQNVSSETGLLKKWPENGPDLIWKYEACGTGFAGVAIAEGRIFTAGDFDDAEYVFALDMDGKLVWKSQNGTSWQGPSPGSRTTPTYNDGILFHMNPTGRLAAYNALSGEPRWAVDLQDEFGARFGTWAMSENVLVDDQHVYCLPGGTRGFAAALDKHTGKTKWINNAIDERAAYCSPVLTNYRGVSQLITLAQRSAVGIDAETGKLLWSHAFGRVWQNTTSPVVHDGYVFVTCGHSSGGLMLKINPDLEGVSRVWYREDFDNCHGGVILRDGYLYGCGCRLGGKGFYCIDFLTGETKYSTTELGKISITYADGMLYCLDNRRRMSLVQPTPTGFRIVSQFRLPPGNDGPSLCHPVVCGGRLYVRHDQSLWVYDVKAK